MASAFSNNIHVSQHPCLRAKLSQLRSNATSCKDTNRLINDIAMIIGCEALGASLQVTPSGMVSTYSSFLRCRDKRAGAGGYRVAEPQSILLFFLLTYIVGYNTSWV